MNLLNGKTLTVKVVDYRKVNQVISEEFPNLSEPYNCVAEEEWSNDIERLMYINGELDEHELRDIQEVLQTGKVKMYRTNTLLNYLCSQGKIDKGDYLIRISW